jgi:hypothetical protein
MRLNVAGTRRVPLFKHTRPAHRWSRPNTSCRAIESNGTRRVPATLTLAILLLALLLAIGGCQRTSAAVKSKRASSSTTQWSDELFSFAVTNLNSLEDNDCAELLNSMNQRLAALQQPGLAPGLAPSSMLLASWPEPDMLRQVISRLNQWVDTLAKPDPGQPDPMLASLPPHLARLPMLSAAELGDVHFTSFDGYELMEATWLRDVARWAKGETSDDLTAARNLFDWTVRNIQLDEDRPDREPQMPWETLFCGHGTELERAWVYVLLLRQCDIDAAILALPAKPATPTAAKDGKDAAKPAAANPSELRPWCVVALIGDKNKEFYLFEPRLGVPIPSAGGLSAGKSGQLEVMPATLKQVIADPKLLDRMADAGEPYWPAAADMKCAVALVEASPIYLEPRAKRIQDSLAGDRKMVLSAEPAQQAKRFKAAAAGISEVQLWKMPYETLQRRMAATPQEAFLRLQYYLRFLGFGGGSLYKGRILHLKGRFFDEKGAIAYYQKARPRTRVVDLERDNREEPAYEMMKAQFKAAGRTVPDQILRQAAKIAVEMDAQAIKLGKVDAAYWLGLVEYEQGEYASAFSYFVTRTLQATGSTVFWESGAHYNMARCDEADGRWSDAFQQYDANARLQHDAVSRLRGNWLDEVHGVKPAIQNKVTTMASDKKQAENSKPANEPVDKSPER